MPETETKRDYRTHAEREVAKRFPRDTADHELTVEHDDGLYRHLRCAKPGSSFYWFEIVTWPGSLAVRGDMGGGWVFSRIDDMFRFFRGNRGSDGQINPGYWAEKLADGARSAKVYSEHALRSQVEDCLAESDLELEKEIAVRKRYVEYEADGQLVDERGARELLAELEQAEVVSDTWEWDLTDWDWPFLWACHAIVWAIREYDRQKAAGGDG